MIQTLNLVHEVWPICKFPVYCSNISAFGNPDKKPFPVLQEGKTAIIPHRTGGNACIRSLWRVAVLIGHFNVNCQRLALHGLAAAIWKPRQIDQGTERTHHSLPLLIAINTHGHFH